MMSQCVLIFQHFTIMEVLKKISATTYLWSPWSFVAIDGIAVAAAAVDVALFLVVVLPFWPYTLNPQ